MKRALSVLVASAGLAVGSLLLTAPSAVAAPQTAQACYLYANAPATTGNQIRGSGGRVGCSNFATFTVYVYKDVAFAPDKEVARATGSGNQGVLAQGACAGAGSYYTYTVSSTGSTQESTRVGRC